MTVHAPTSKIGSILGQEFSLVERKLNGSSNSSNSHRATLQQLASELIRRAQTKANRYILGIVGPPAAGKSTLAQNLVIAVNSAMDAEKAILVPMDGFHLPNDTLDQMGARFQKGAPETFDAEGFADLMARLSHLTEEAIWCPIFDRNADEPIENAVRVGREHSIVVVEGNYLLLNTPPWDQVRRNLDEVWYLDASIEARARRLMERHMLGGRSENDATRKIVEVDNQNAALIQQTRPFADRIIWASDEEPFVDGDLTSVNDSDGLLRPRTVCATVAN